MRRPTLPRSLDQVAMGLSGLCLVHCAATSILLGVVASAGGIFAAPIIHEVGLAVALIFALIAFARGIIEHGMLLPSWIGGTGLAFMAAALIAPHGAGETVLTMIGVGFLAVGHWFNRRAFG